MQLGVMIEGQEGLNWQRWHHIIALVEQLGFESLWRSDHFFSLGGHPERDALETWVSLVDLASRSTRLRFGPLVSAMTFRHPALVARMAAAVDDLSDGRLILGVGAGWNVAEHEAFGFSLPPIGERMDRLEEGIQVMMALWTGERVSFAGTYYTLDNAQSRPTPKQQPHPPLLVGGNGERRTLRIAAAYADEWNSINLSPEVYRTKIGVLEQHCAEVGRDPAAIRRSAMLAFIIGRDAAELRARAEHVRPYSRRLEGMDADAVLETTRAMGWLVGTPEQFVAHLHELDLLGVQRVMLQHHDQTDDAALELIAGEVLPALSRD